MHYFSTLFDKELYMFRIDLLSIVRSLNTVFTAIGICYTSYVDCLLARSGKNISVFSCHYFSAQVPYSFIYQFVVQSYQKRALLNNTVK